MRKTIKLFSWLASIALSGAVAPALAQTAAATAAATPAATAAATPAAPTVTVDGMVDAYYGYNFTYPAAFTTGKAGDFYNGVANSFTLGLAEAKLTATQGQASGHLVLADSNGTISGLASPGIDVLQGYVSYNPGQWTINAGRFVAWMGYEVIESTSNWNYSHSLLFGELPFWHDGVSVNYAPSTIFNATVYDTDTDWNSDTSTTWGKTWGLEVAITPNSMWGITLNGIMTPIGGVGTQSNMTGEAIITYKPSAWNFALDAQYGTNTIASGVTGPAPSLFGVALYGHYQIQSDWAAALRLEYLSDPKNDYTAPGGTVLYDNSLPAGDSFSATEVTLTIEHDFTTNLIARAEGRIDIANSGSSATDASDVFATGTSTGSSSNVTGTASMAFTF